MAYIQGSGGAGITKKSNIVKGVSVNGVLSDVYGRKYDITQQAKLAIQKAQEAKKRASGYLPTSDFMKLERSSGSGYLPGFQDITNKGQGGTTVTPPGKTVIDQTGKNNDGYKPTNTPGATSPAAGGLANNNAGMSDDEYRNSLIEAVKGGVISEYEANMAVIKNNLTTALSSLDAELAALEPLYQNQLKTIASNQFSTGEATKEMMNQAGWTGANSGLAIGEQSKIAIAADTNRANALQAKVGQETDINRRKTLAQDTFGTNAASLEAQKNAKLSGASAEALIQAEERRRSMYESDREYQMEVAKFKESQAQFRANLAEDRRQFDASQKASQAKTDAAAASSKGDEAYESAYNSLISGLYDTKTAEDATAWLREVGQDTSVPTDMKNKLYDFYEKFVDNMYLTNG